METDNHKIEFKVNLLKRWNLSFEIETKRGTPIAKVIQKNIFTHKFTAELNGWNYILKRSGKWGLAFDMLKGDLVVCHMKYHGGRKFTIHIPGSMGQDREFVLKRAKIMRREIVLRDQQGHDLLFILPKYNWRHLQYEMQIETDNAEIGSDHLLILCAAFCAHRLLNLTG